MFQSISLFQRYAYIMHIFMYIQITQKPAVEQGEVGSHRTVSQECETALLPGDQLRLKLIVMASHTTAARAESKGGR